MSLILEALRKSEAERRRGEMPDLRAELPPSATPRRTPMRALPWIAATAALAIVAILLWHPWSRDTARPIVASAHVEPKPRPDESVRLQPRAQPMAEAPSTPRTTTRVADGTPPPAKMQPASSPTSEPAPAAAPVVDDTTPALPATAAETSINALPADLRKALPPLQLTMHMWDPDAAKRFVIIDGERHVEGDSVGPMQLRRIDADGVLFDWQGRAIRLPLR